MTYSSSADAEVLGRAVEASDHHRCSDGAQDAHHHVGLQDRPAGVDAGQVCRVRVAAVGVDVAAEAATRGEEGHGDGDHGDDDDRPRDAHRRPAALPAAPRCLARQPTWRRGPWACSSGWRRRPGRAPRAQPTTPSRISGPQRPQPEPEASSLPAVVGQEADDGEAADDGQQPGRVAAERPSAPPPICRNVASMPVTAAPLESTQTTPRRASSPPRVTTNEGTPM